MSGDLIPVTFHKIMQSKSYTLFILGASDKKFGIYTDPKVGQTIQSVLTDKAKARPYTHDLINSLITGLNIKLLQTLIYDVQDTVYYAKLYLEQEIDSSRKILEIDARPSDCLTLALMNDIPIYCKQDALEKTTPVED